MSVSDDIRRWSDELARSPASMVFLPLGEALRTRGQADVALRVAFARARAPSVRCRRAHDLLARIYVDRGETERALDEWDAAIRCTPGHAGALKGMGFVCFNQGRIVDAERYLAEAAAAIPEDDGLGMALRQVREANREREYGIGTRARGRARGGGPAPAPSPVANGVSSSSNGKGNGEEATSSRMATVIRDSCSLISLA